MLRSVVFVVVALTLVSGAFGQSQRRVNPAAGADFAGCGFGGAQQCLTISYALVQSGATDILLEDGTYLLNSTNDRITVCDAGLCAANGNTLSIAAENVGGAILDCEDAGVVRGEDQFPGIYVRGNPAGTGLVLTLSGFVVQRCFPGLRIENFAGTVIDVTVRENHRYNFVGIVTEGAGIVMSSNIIVLTPVATFRRVTVDNNTAIGGSGAGIYSQRHQFDLDTVTVTNNNAINSADVGGAILGGRGGGIYRTGVPLSPQLSPPMVWTDVIVRGNTATVSGAGAWLESSDPVNPVVFAATNVVVENNVLTHSATSGAALFQGSASGVMFQNAIGVMTGWTVNANVMIGQVVPLTGGGVVATAQQPGSGLVLRDFVVSNNLNQVGVSVTGSDRTAKGAGVAYLRTTPVIDNIHIFGNIAGAGAGNGAGFYLIPQSASIQPGQMNNSVVENNNAGNGGGFFLAGIADVTTPFNSINLRNVTVRNNVATGFGGGMYVGGANVGILALTHFSANTATDGGGIYVTQGSDFLNPARSNVYVQGATFDGNIALDSGGAINVASPVLGQPLSAYIHGLFASGSLFANNVAQKNSIVPVSGPVPDNAIGSGGAWSLNNANTTSSANTFDGNRAGQAGGAIAISGTVGVFSSNLDTLINNEAFAGTGGGLNIIQVPVTIYNGFISDNVASRSGGGVYSSGAIVDFGSNTTVQIASGFCDASGCCETGCLGCDGSFSFLPQSFQCPSPVVCCTAGSTTTPVFGTSTSGGLPPFNCSDPAATKQELKDNSCPGARGSDPVLSTGAIVGIVVGPIALVLCIVICCCCICICLLCLIPTSRKRRKKGPASPYAGGAGPVDEDTVFN